MSEQKIYVFTTDHLLTIEGDEREIKEGWLIFMDFDSEWLLRTSGRACIIIPNKVIDELLQSGTIIDYPEPTMVSNDLPTTGIKEKVPCVEKPERTQVDIRMSKELNQEFENIAMSFGDVMAAIEEIKQPKETGLSITMIAVIMSAASLALSIVAIFNMNN
jgi:hypothetical protein